MSADCCTYDCNQGRDCPVRKYTCDQLGACNGGPNCTCMDEQPGWRGYTTLLPREGGGFVDASTIKWVPTEQQDEPLGVWEAVFLYGSMGTCGVMTIAVAAGVLGWLYGTFGG